MPTSLTGFPPGRLPEPVHAQPAWGLLDDVQVELKTDHAPSFSNSQDILIKWYLLNI
jgi:hypothetical protein